jgi:hypothetical protein
MLRSFRGSGSGLAAASTADPTGSGVMRMSPAMRHCLPGQQFCLGPKQNPLQGLTAGATHPCCLVVPSGLGIGVVGCCITSLTQILHITVFGI